LFEDFNGIPYPQFFGQKQAYKRYSFWEKALMDWKLFGSFVWWVAGFNTWGALFELFGGKWAQLSFLQKYIWWGYRTAAVSPANKNYGVYYRNSQFVSTIDYAQGMAALWFFVLFPINFFFRITAGGMYDIDFDELDAKGYDYSLTQATSYHYWEGKEQQGILKMLWVNYVNDAWTIFTTGFVSVFVFAVYTLTEILMVFLFPLILTIKVITPWSENELETW